MNWAIFSNFYQLSFRWYCLIAIYFSSFQSTLSQNVNHEKMWSIFSNSLKFELSSSYCHCFPRSIITLILKHGPQKTPTKSRKKTWLLCTFRGVMSLQLKRLRNFYSNIYQEIMCFLVLIMFSWTLSLLNYNDHF